MSLTGVRAFAAPSEQRTTLREAPACESILDRQGRLDNAEMILLHAAKRRQRGLRQTFGDEEMRALHDMRKHGGPKEQKFLEALSQSPIFSLEDRELLTQIAILLLPEAPEAQAIDREVKKIVTWLEVARTLRERNKTLGERHELLSPEVEAALIDNAVSPTGIAAFLKKLGDQNDVELALLITHTIVDKRHLRVDFEIAFADDALRYARFTLQQVLYAKPMPMIEIMTALFALKRFSNDRSELVLGEAALEKAMSLANNSALKKLLESYRIDYLQPLRQRLTK